MGCVGGMCGLCVSVGYVKYVWGVSVYVCVGYVRYMWGVCGGYVRCAGVCVCACACI